LVDPFLLLLTVLALPLTPAKEEEREDGLTDANAVARDDGADAR